MRQLLATVVAAMMLAACGTSGASPTPSPATAATVTPSAAPTSSPSPTAPPSSPPASVGPSGSGAFVLAGLAASVGTSGPPDPSTFATSFASETPTIYVAYQLAAGLSGTVTATWGTVGQNPIVKSFDYPASAPWAYFTLTYKDGFIPADYLETLRFEPTGASVSLPFTITGPRKAPATPTPLPSGTSAFTLLRAATGADSSKPAPDPSTYTDSFSTTASAIYIVFSLRSGLTGTVSCAMTANGSPYVQGLSLDYGTGNSWGDFQVTPSGTFPAGDYVATITYTPTGETQTVNFTVK